MSQYVFPPAPVSAITVFGTDQMYPVRRIYCVGHTYAAHAREMGASDTRAHPFFFSKPADAVAQVREGQVLELAYPPKTKDFQFEIELVAAIGKGGRDITPANALEHIYGYAAGLDMTRRDLQSELRRTGSPWEIAKIFGQSAPIGPIYPVSQYGHPTKADLWLNVNGMERQRNNIENMLWPVAEIIAYLSRFLDLEAGDLVYTGTPGGSGAVTPGDLMEGGVEGFGTLRVKVV